MRHYFFSYFFEKGGNTGFGQISIDRPGLIQSGHDLDGVAEFIRKKNKFKHVAIQSWQRYEQPMALIGGAK